MNEVHHHRYVYDAEYAPDREHDRHRHKRLAGAATDCGDRMRKREQAVKKRLYARLSDACRNNVGIIRKQPDKQWRGDEEHDSDKL